MAAARAAEALAVAVQVVAVQEAEVQVAVEMASAAMVTATAEEAGTQACPQGCSETSPAAGAMEGEETALAWTVAVARVAAVQVVAAWGEAASAVVA